MASFAKGSCMALLVAAVLLLATQVHESNAYGLYEQVKEPQSTRAFQPGITWQTTKDATGAIVKVERWLDTCVLSSWNGVQKYIRFGCDTSEVGRIIVNTYDVTLSPWCIGPSEQHLLPKIYIDDNSRLTQVYGAATTVQITCSLTIDMTKDDMKLFTMTDRVHAGRCSSNTASRLLYTHVGDVFFKPVTAGTFNIFTNATVTRTYPCANSTGPDYCRGTSTSCVETTDPDLYLAPQKGVTTLSLYDIVMREPVVTVEQIQIMSWPQHTSSRVLFGLWCGVLTLLFVFSQVATYYSHSYTLNMQFFSQSEKK